jgi:carbon-monoxide dehydrogenase medium subunit
MKAAPFDHVHATDVAHAVGLLAQEGARVLAGGHSLLPLMAMRRTTPTLLVDLGRIPSLAGVRDTGTHIEIGSMTRHRDVETSPLVQEHLPLLATALGHVGYVTVRNRGTLGGSIVNADPAAEAPAVLCALDGEVIAEGRAGERRIPASAFFLSAGVTALSPDEILTGVRIPKADPGALVSVHEFARRRCGWAVVAAFGTATVRDGSLVGLRLSLAGVGDTPFRATVAEELLTDRQPTPELLREAAAAVAAAVTPVGDQHAPAAYRRRLAGVLTRRCLEDLT